MNLFTNEISEKLCDTNYIYKMYKDIISDLIAYIEVYEHDLPAEIMAQMAELFQTMAICETDESIPMNSELSTMLEQTAWKITQSLYKHSTCLFIKKIYEYRKIFRKFKYKGVFIDGKKFYQIADDMEREICKLFSQNLKKCYKGKTLITLRNLSFRDCCQYMRSKFVVFFSSSFFILKKEPFLPEERLIAANRAVADFSNVYNMAINLLEKYENVFPLVVKNGRNRSLAMSVFVAVSAWIVPIVLTIPIILKIIATAKMFICK